MKYANETVVEELKKDNELLKLHLEDAINELFEGEHRVARLMLRDIVNASIGFKALAKKLDKNSKTIMGMLTVDANPTAKNLFNIIHEITAYEHMKIEGVQIEAA